MSRFLFLMMGSLRGSLAASIWLLVPVCVGVWFASQQSFALAQEYFATPLSLFSATAIRIALLVLLSMLCVRRLLLFLSGERLARLGVFGFLPLLLVFVGVPFPVLLRVVLGAALLCVVWGAMSLRSPVLIRHAIAFGVIVLVHVLWNAHESPLVWHQGQFATPAHYTSEIWLISLLYKSVIWIKQFSLSMMDYDYFATAPYMPVHYSSPVFQFLVLLGDVPSIDTHLAYVWFHVLLFAITVFGAFGYYLFLYRTLALQWRFAVVGGGLFYFIGGLSLWQMLTDDYFAGLSVYCVFPYVCMAVQRSFASRGSVGWSFVTGMLLAFPYFLLAPHPEYFIYFISASAVVCAVFFFAPSYADHDARIGWPKRTMLLVWMAVGFLLCGATEWVPLIGMKLSREMTVVGHGVVVWDATQDWQRYFDLPSVMLPYAIAVALSVLVLGLWSWHMRVRLSPWCVVMLLLFALFCPVLSAPFLALSHVTHVPLNISYVFRRYVFADLAALTLGLMAFDVCRRFAIARAASRSDYGLLSVDALFFAGVCILAWSLQIPIRAQDPYLFCPYVTTTRAMLANYPLLAGDAANARALKDRLVLFEEELERLPSSSYQLPYRTLLSQAQIDSVKQLRSPEEMVAFAARAQAVVDAFLLDPALHCVSAYQARSYGINRRIVNMNVPALYTVDEPFLRIVSMTRNDQLPASSREYLYARDSHLGVGPGLLIHNMNAAFDSRFAFAAPILHAFYVFPDHAIASVGTYDSPVNWGWSPQVLREAHTRLILDVSGMDVVTLHAHELRSRSVPSGLVPLHSEFSESDFAQRTGLQDARVFLNTRSFGLAYLAHQVRVADPDAVRAIEKDIRAHLFSLHTGVFAAKYDAAMEQLRGYLSRLKHHDVWLERLAPVSLTPEPPGTMRIRALLGEATLMQVECARSQCFLVYNQAKLPAWKAYVDGNFVPIERANFAFMAIPVPEGEHRVWFIYLDWWHVLASVITLLALSCVVAKPHWRWSFFRGSCV